MAVFLQRGRAMSWRHLHRIEIQGEIERALSDAAKLLPDAAPPHLRDDFTIQQLQRLAEAFAANEVAGYQRQ